MRLNGSTRPHGSAKRLRREMTLPEVLLWRELRRGGVGERVRNQHPAGDYVLDFYCAPARLAIEVDGAVHAIGDRPERDDRRDDWLRARGVLVLRIPATEILRNLDGVVRHIRDLVQARTSGG